MQSKQIHISNITRKSTSEILDFLKVIGRHSIIMVLFAASALVGAVAFHFFYPRFMSVSSLHIRSAQNSPLLVTAAKISGYPLQGYDFESKPDKYLKVLNSQGLEEYIKSNIKSYSKITAAFDGKDEQEITDYLLSAITFRSNTEDLIDIIVVDNSPEKTKLIATTVAELAKNYIVSYESQELSDAEAYLIEELTASEERITKNSIEVEQIKAREKLITISSGNLFSVKANSIAKLNEELDSISVKRRELKFNIQKIIAALKIPENEMDGSQGVPLKGRVIEQLRALREEREVLDSKKKAVEDQLFEIYASQQPESEQKIYDLKLKLDSEHTIFKDLRRQLFETRVNKIAIKNTIRLYSKSSTLEATNVTSLPKKLSYTLVVALALSILIIYVLESFNPVISNKKDFSLFKINYLGQIPNLLNSSLNQKKSLICNFKIKNQGTTAFRYLRTRIQQLIAKSNKDQFIISTFSPRSNEGKSVMTANLAVGFGNIDFKTIVVDFDFAKQSLNELFELNPKYGVSDILTNQVNIKDAIKKEVYPNVDYLSAGNAHDSIDELNSDALKNLFSELKKEYKLIIVDTPAFKATPEGLSLAPFVDMMVMVACANVTRLLDVEETCEILSYHGVEEIYGVLNRVELPFGTYLYPYYDKNYFSESRSSNSKLAG